VFSNQDFFISEPGENFNDFIFLASQNPLNLAPNGMPADQAEWLKTRKLPLDNSKGTILTDDLNPLEHLQTAKAEHYRHVIVDAFGPELLVR